MAILFVSTYTYVQCCFIHVYRRYRRRKHNGLTCKGTELQDVIVYIEFAALMRRIWQRPMHSSAYGAP